jgi:hypothetical protein
MKKSSPKATPKPQQKAAAKAPAPAATNTRAAVNEQQTAAFLREVDEAMRLERWQTIWHKGKWPMAGGVLALIAAAAAWQGWQSWQAYQDRSTATRWAELAEIKDPATLAAALPTFVAQSHGGYQAIALLAQAAQAETPAQKILAYRAIQSNPNQPEWLRAMAQLNAAIILLGTEPLAAKGELEVLAQTEFGKAPLPTAPMALELLAIDALQRQDLPSARAYTQRLLQLPEQGGQLTPTLHQRALERLGALGGA